MSVFKPRKKQIVTEETDTSLPQFRIDVNGFLMFLDEELGGCGVFEVTPAVWNAAWSHEDDYRAGESIDRTKMVSSSGVQYADARRVIVPVWVAFLNSLLPKDNNTSQTHIQILGKKTRTDKEESYNWTTCSDYVYAQTASAINDNKEYFMSDNNRRIRTRDYLMMLGRYALRSHERSTTFDPTHATAYETRWYIVVSYTPSSEGWWYDGRDSDYYMVEDALDLSHPLSMFSNPKTLDQLTDMIMSRRQKKRIKEEVNTANDIFPLATDITASVIQSRMRSIERTYERLAKKLASGKKPLSMPFSLRRLTGRELAATIAFFDDVTTPYYEKAITQLQTNTNEVFMQMDADMAVLSRDISYVERYDDDILRGNVNLEANEAEAEDFKRRYANAADVVFGREDEERPPVDPSDSGSMFSSLGFDPDEDINAMWEDMGVGADDSGKTDDQLFLERYGKRKVSLSQQKKQDTIRQKLQSRNQEPDDDDEGWDDIDSFMGR